MNDGNVHLVLYDGDCGLCNRLVQFILQRDIRGVFRFASLQSPTGLAVLTTAGAGPALPNSFHVVERFGTDQARIFTKSDAVIFVARQLRWPWRTGVALRLIPGPLRDRAYDAMARSRYSWFGRADQCAVNSPDVRDRFIH